MSYHNINGPIIDIYVPLSCSLITVNKRTVMNYSLYSDTSLNKKDSKKKSKVPFSDYK